MRVIKNGMKSYSNKIMENQYLLYKIRKNNQENKINTLQNHYYENEIILSPMDSGKNIIEPILQFLCGF